LCIYSNNVNWQSTMKRFHKLASVIALSIALLSADNAVTQQPYFMGLGDLAGGNYHSLVSNRHGISYDGSVVVGGSINNEGNLETFRWTRETGMAGLGVQFNGAYLSVDGTTVVGHQWINDDVIHYRWTAQTGGITLPLDFGLGISVSGDGSIIAGVLTSLTGPSRSFRWTESGGVELLPIGRAYQISASGSEIFGFAGPRYYIWSASDETVWLDLPDPSNDVRFSDNGQVVSGTKGPVQDRRGYRWTKETGVVELGRLPDGRSMSASGGPSADGSIIVGYSQNVSPQRPAIWDVIHGARYLDDILANELGLSSAMGGWTELKASGVSGNGRSVIGDGINPDGNPEAWIAYLGPPGLAGDFNSDGTVDAADYIVCRNGLGMTYTPAGYDVWRANFGRSAAGAAAAAAQLPHLTTPEPGALLLAVLALAPFAQHLRSPCGRRSGLTCR
jgi:uncharacterized membrane protein